MIGPIGPRRWYQCGGHAGDSTWAERWIPISVSSVTSSPRLSGRGRQPEGLGLDPFDEFHKYAATVLRMDEVDPRACGAASRCVVQHPKPG